MANGLPVPIQDPIATRRNWKRFPDPLEKSDPNENIVSDPWRVYLEQLGVQAQNSPQFSTLPVSSSSQTASIGTTDIAGNLAGGVYRVTFAALIVVAASVSSSLTVNFAWTSNSLTQTLSSSAITGNTTTTHASLTYTMVIDNGTPITYSTTWVDNAVGSGAYDLTVTLESLNG
jgi:hypothetical protein